MYTGENITTQTTVQTRVVSALLAALTSLTSGFDPIHVRIIKKWAFTPPIWSRGQQRYLAYLSHLVHYQWLRQSFVSDQSRPNNKPDQVLIPVVGVSAVSNNIIIIISDHPLPRLLLSNTYMPIRQTEFTIYRHHPHGFSEFLKKIQISDTIQ